MKFSNKPLFKGLYLIEAIALGLILISNVLFTGTVTGNEQVVDKGNNLILSLISLVFVAAVVLLFNRIIHKPKTISFLIISQLIYRAVLLLWIKTSRVAPFADQDEEFLQSCL